MKTGKFDCNSQECHATMIALQKELEKLILWLYLSALLVELGEPTKQSKTPIQRKVNEILKEALSRPTRTH